jgi:hypothetical protein
MGSRLCCLLKRIMFHLAHNVFLLDGNRNKELVTDFLFYDKKGVGQAEDEREQKGPPVAADTKDPAKTRIVVPVVAPVPAAVAAAPVVSRNVWGAGGDAVSGAQYAERSRRTNSLPAMDDEDRPEARKRKRGTPPGTDIPLRMTGNTWKPFRKPMVECEAVGRQRQLKDIIRMFIEYGLEVTMANFDRLGFGKGPTQRDMFQAIAEALLTDDTATEKELTWAKGVMFAKRMSRPIK